MPKNHDPDRPSKVASSPAEASPCWQQISVATTAALADATADLLSELGALSVSLEDAADQPLFEPAPGETPVWRHTRVIALFEEPVEAGEVRQALEENYGAACYGGWKFETIADRAWERAWLDHFRPMRFGSRLWIIPSGFPPPPDPAAVCVLLDPGLAFGTGAHPTTALCLEWLDSNPVNGKTLIDYGCGSGILAVAGLALGAAAVKALDIDPQALTATRENARKNGVDGRLTCWLAPQLPGTPADVVLANILANPLLELAPRLAALVEPGGHLVLSGILEEQADAVLAAYRTWFRMAPPVARDGWVRLAGVRLAA